MWLATDAANATRASRVLQNFAGFGRAEVSPSKLARPNLAFVFGREPIRVDILTTPLGVEFAECWRRRKVFVLDGIRVPVISLPDLRAAKRAAGRLKDLADLENLPDKSDPAARPSHQRKRKSS